MSPRTTYEDSIAHAVALSLACAMREWVGSRSVESVAVEHGYPPSYLRSIVRGDAAGLSLMRLCQLAALAGTTPWHVIDHDDTPPTPAERKRAAYLASLDRHDLAQLVGDGLARAAAKRGLATREASLLVSSSNGQWQRVASGQCSLARMVAYARELDGVRDVLM